MYIEISVNVVVTIIIMIIMILIYSEIDIIVFCPACCGATCSSLAAPCMVQSPPRWCDESAANHDLLRGECLYHLSINMFCNGIQWDLMGFNGTINYNMGLIGIKSLVNKFDVLLVKIEGPVCYTIYHPLPVVEGVNTSLY